MMPEPAWRIRKWQGHGRDPALLSVTGPMKVVIWTFGRLMLACLVQLIAYRSSTECAARRSGFQPFGMALLWPSIRLMIAFSSFIRPRPDGVAPCFSEVSANTASSGNGGPETGRD